MTITSILMWFSFFDVGLGNGMRNYMTQAISANDYKTARAYLSTTLCVLTVISIGLGLLCIPCLALDFNMIFNTYALSNDVLKNALFIAVLFTLTNFVLKNIGFVFIALQKYGLNDVLTTAGSVFGLITVFILTKTTQGNLLYVVTAFTLSPVLVYLIAAICNIFYKVWVGPSVTVPIQISAVVLLYISSFNFNNCVTYLLNGLNKITVQIITSVASTILYLLFILLFGGKIGMASIILSMAVCYILMSAVHLYQCRLLIDKKTKGIWNK